MIPLIHTDKQPIKRAKQSVISKPDIDSTICEVCQGSQNSDEWFECRQCGIKLVHEVCAVRLKETPVYCSKHDILDID